MLVHCKLKAPKTFLFHKYPKYQGQTFCYYDKENKVTIFFFIFRFPTYHQPVFPVPWPTLHLSKAELKVLEIVSLYRGVRPYKVQSKIQSQ